MIYDQPKFMPAGDRYVLIEFGNEMNLDLNFTAQGLATAAAEAKIKGIIETAPCFASLLVHYEPAEIRYEDVVREFSRLSASLGSSEDIEIESRLFYLPALYLDPWTKACVEDYCVKIAKKVPDPELLVQENGLDDVDHLVRLHSSSEYWVASLGFWPGLPFLMPLDPRARLTAPKYNPPRTTHPAGRNRAGRLLQTRSIRLQRPAAIRSLPARRSRSGTRAGVCPRSRVAFAFSGRATASSSCPSYARNMTPRMRPLPNAATTIRSSSTRNSWSATTTTGFRKSG